MKKILFALLLVSGIAQGQGDRMRPVFKLVGMEVQYFRPFVVGYTNISSRYKWIATAVDSGLHIPQYNGVPTDRVGVWMADGAIAADTLNGHFYYRNGGSWIRVAKFSDIAAGAINIYNTSSSLTAARVVEQAGFQLMIQNAATGMYWRLQPSQGRMEYWAESGAGATFRSVAFDATPDDVFMQAQDTVGNVYLVGAGVGGVFHSVGTGVLLQVSNAAARSLINIKADSIAVEPFQGVINIDTLRTWAATTVTDTAFKKVVTWDIRNGRLEYGNWHGGSGGATSPAGNFGNVQINRWGSFDTPASDSLDFDGGLKIKGVLNVDGSGTNFFDVTANSISSLMNGSGFDHNFTFGGGNIILSRVPDVSGVTSSLNLSTSATLNSQNTTGPESFVQVFPDSITLDSDVGRFQVPNMETSTDTTLNKPMVWNLSTKRWTRLDRWPTGGSSGITVASTTITSGMNGGIIYDNSGVVGEDDDFLYDDVGKGLWIGQGSGDGEVRSYQSTTIYVALKTDGGSNKSGLFRSNTNFFVYYNTSTGSTEIQATFAGSEVLINPDGGNFDTRIKGDNDVNLFWADAGVDKIGIKTNAPHSSLHVAGSFAVALLETESGITLDDSHYTVVVTATGQTITLPTSASITGRIYTIKLVASGSCTVATTSSQTIDGSTTYSLASQYKYVTVQSNGSGWHVIANN